MKRRPIFNAKWIEKNYPETGRAFLKYAKWLDIRSGPDEAYIKFKYQTWLCVFEDIGAADFIKLSFLESYKMYLMQFEKERTMEFLSTTK